MAQVTEQAVGRNVPTFLDVLAWCEGTSTSPYSRARGYDVIVRGADRVNEIFSDFRQHPFEVSAVQPQGREPKLIIPADPARGIEKPTFSTASGRYQITLGTWRGLVHVIGMKTLPDFGSVSQDLGAIELIREHRDAGGSALEYVRAGEIEKAITLCSRTWASLPGTPSVQGHGPKSMVEVLDQFHKLKAMN